MAPNYPSQGYRKPKRNIGFLAPAAAAAIRSVGFPSGASGAPTAMGQIRIPPARPPSVPRPVPMANPMPSPRLPPGIAPGVARTMGKALLPRLLPLLVPGANIAIGALQLYLLLKWVSANVHIPKPGTTRNCGWGGEYGPRGLSGGCQNLGFVSSVSGPNPSIGLQADGDFFMGTIGPHPTTPTFRTFTRTAFYSSWVGATPAEVVPEHIPGFAEPLENPNWPPYLPTIDPMAKPINSPLTFPETLPVRDLPYRRPNNPLRAPSERTVRGPVRPRLRTKPRLRLGRIDLPLPNPATPKPAPGLEPVVEHIFGRDGTVITRPGVHVRRPPTRGEKEKKGVGKATGALAGLQALAYAGTEAADWIEAIWKSLPAKIRRKYGKNPGYLVKFDAIMNNLKHVDLGKAFVNVLTNQVEDALIGGFMRKAPWRSKLRLGPAGMGGTYVQPNL